MCVWRCVEVSVEVCMECVWRCVWRCVCDAYVYKCMCAGICVEVHVWRCM